MRRLLIMMVAAVLPCMAQAQDATPPALGTVDRMFHDTQKARVVCRLAMQVQLIKRELAGSGVKDGDKNANEGETCIAREKIEMGQSYKAAIAKLAKKPEALKSAKQYHVFALTMLDGMHPLGGEVKIQYVARQNANDVRLKELENLVRVDAQ